MMASLFLRRGEAVMLFDHRKQQLKIITQKRTALKLLVLSGAIRRADVEIQFRSSKSIQPMIRPHRDTAERGGAV